MGKIMLVIGNCRRKGNTEQLAEAFMRGAVDAGHEVQLVDLRKTKVNGCIGCNACRYGKPCIQRDDFNGLAPDIRAADVLVFASPLHFWMLSSAIMAFIERFYCIAMEDENPQHGRYEKYPVKACALLMTSADDNFWTYDKVRDYYRYNLIDYLDAEDRGCLFAGGCGDTNGKPQIAQTGWLDEAYDFGRKILP